MSTFEPGLVHTPVTPFTRDNAIDWKTYGKLIDFHVAQGAEALALPMHVGESVSLSDEEQRKLLAFVIDRVQKKVPVIAQVSDAGTSVAVDRARNAEQVGAAAVLMTTPYYWTPPPGMLYEHFEAVGAAIRAPFYIWHTPDEQPGPKISTELVLKLIDKLPNFAGVVDSSNDWQFQINVLSNARRKRGDFQLLCGTEYMISASANGATSMLCALAGVAPVLVKRLYQICRKEDYAEARKLQEQLAILRQITKGHGIGGIKAAMAFMGRDCGVPRPPLSTPDETQRAELTAELEKLDVLRAEPRGW